MKFMLEVGLRDQLHFFFARSTFVEIRQMYL